MKHTSSLLLLAAISLGAIADAGARTPQVGDTTFTGSVKLTRASVSAGSTGAPAGGKIANLSVSGTTREQLTVQEITDVDPPTLAGFLGTISKANQGRISNSTILKELDQDGIIDGTRGYSLRVVLFYNKPAFVQAFHKTKGPVAVPASYIDNLYFGWAESFDGIFQSAGLNNSASATVSNTVSGTSIVLTGNSKVSGFNAVEGTLFGDIDFTGVGSFSENKKGYTTSANVAGGNF
jgi:hypothetical protein